MYFERMINVSDDTIEALAKKFNLCPTRCVTHSSDEGRLIRIFYKKKAKVYLERIFWKSGKGLQVKSSYSYNKHNLMFHMHREEN